MRTPRPHARTRRAAAALIVALTGMVSLAGCDPRALLYFLQPNDLSIPAPGPKLEGKKVVLVTHVLSGAMGEYQSLDRDLTREIASLLKTKVKKIQVVDRDKVSSWVDAHPKWTDPAELAEAFEADVVIYLEVEGFQLANQGDLNVLQGTAKTHIKVTEMAHPTNPKGKPILDQPKEAKTIYDDYCDTEFPRRGPMPSESGFSRSAFKTRFVKIVAAEISWHFVDHAPDDNIQDTKFNGQ